MFNTKSVQSMDEHRNPVLYSSGSQMGVRDICKIYILN